MVYFYSRKEEVVPRLFIRSQDLQASQVVVTIPPLFQEGDKNSEEILCDRCFLDAINIALLPVIELKSHVKKLSLQQYTSMATTRASTKKQKLLL
jgi:hypothetical protein